MFTHTQINNFKWVVFFYSNLWFTRTTNSKTKPSQNTFRFFRLNCELCKWSLVVDLIYENSTTERDTKKILIIQCHESKQYYVFDDPLNHTILLVIKLFCSKILLKFQLSQRPHAHYGWLICISRSLQFVSINHGIDFDFSVIIFNRIRCAVFCYSDCFFFFVVVQAL